MGEELSEGEKWAIVGIIAGIAFAPFTGGASVLGSIASAIAGAFAAEAAEEEDC